jgi:hypothetical protein
MSETKAPPVATLGEVRIAGSALPADGDTVRDALVVLRPNLFAGFDRIPAYTGMPLLVGDMLGARAHAFGAEVVFKDGPSLQTAAHEVTHVIQRRNVAPVNEAYFEAAKAAARLEDMLGE